MDAEADEIIGLYRRHAKAWDEARGDRLREGAWLDRFLDLVPPGETVLDLGCGSGRPMARYCIETSFAAGDTEGNAGPTAAFRDPLT